MQALFAVVVGLVLAASAGWARLTTLGHAGLVASGAFSPDGALLASGAEDGTVLLWRSFPE